MALKMESACLPASAIKPPLHNVIARSLSFASAAPDCDEFAARGDEPPVTGRSCDRKPSTTQKHHRRAAAELAKCCLQGSAGVSPKTNENVVDAACDRCLRREHGMRIVPRRSF